MKLYRVKELGVEGGCRNEKFSLTQITQLYHWEGLSGVNGWEGGGDEMKGVKDVGLQGWSDGQGGCGLWPVMNLIRGI